MKVVIRRFDQQTILAATTIVTDEHRRFGIHREAENRFIGLKRQAQLLELGKDRLGFSRFFGGDFSGRCASGTPFH